jgi:hypothetical protein
MSKDKLQRTLKKIGDALDSEHLIPDEEVFTPPDKYLSEKVPFRAFKDNDKYKDDITVTINGKTWVIQRGVQVMIPRFVLHAIENSERQKTDSANHNQVLMDQFKEKEKQLT